MATNTPANISLSRTPASRRAMDASPVANGIATGPTAFTNEGDRRFNMDQQEMLSRRAWLLAENIKTQQT
jgi:hypothetical protein